MREIMIGRLILVALLSALVLAACGANQDSPYDRGCAFTMGCGPAG